MTDLDLLTRNTSYNEQAKKDFHRVAAKYLKRLQRYLSDMYGEGGVRHNKGGIAVSGEVTLHVEKLYVQVSQSALRNGDIMFRECDGLKDYSGGRNNFASMSMLLETEELARLIQRCCPVK